MGHIFISYSHKDKPYVKKLYTTLREQGFDPWIDERIDYGTRWPKVIQDTLDACEVFVVVMSENSYESEWVQSEVARAKRKRKPFFPLLLQGDPWLTAESSHWYNVTDNSLPDEKFYSQLAKFTKRKKPVEEIGSRPPAPERNSKYIPQPISEAPSPKKGIQPAYGIIGGAVAVVALLMFGINSLGNTAAPSEMPETVNSPVATETIFVPSQTPIPPTNTAEPPTPIPTPTLGVGSTLISEKDGMPMVFVPAGEFTMGGDADDALAECKKFTTDCSRTWFIGEEPPHTVFLNNFWIDQTEVTNAMYAKCVASGVCKEPSSKKSSTHDSYYGNFQFDNYPVINVDWNTAKTYCEWRGDRLPTEAEWEKAARGPNGNVYPWGNEFDGSKVNFCDSNCSYDWANKSFNDGYADVSPVKNYPSGQSIYGAYDMAGNVWEWVNDWYDEKYYPNSPASNPTGSASGTYRVMRGGSWSISMYDVRASSRNGNIPTLTYDSVSFRCSRSQ
jgi:formylglycine-generating enzyme required for sulfatase activity